MRSDVGAADPRSGSPWALARQLNVDAPRVAMPVPEPLPVLPPPPPLLPLRARLARGETVPMLLFTTGGEAFLTPLSDVREAVDAPAVQALPRASGAGLGGLVLRGDVLPVTDPGPVLGVGPALGGAALVTTGERPVVLLVDDVLDAVAVSPADLRSLPVALTADGLLVGAVPAGPRLAAVLDLPLLLAALDLSR